MLLKNSPIYGETNYRLAGKMVIAINFIGVRCSPDEQSDDGWRELFDEYRNNKTSDRSI